MSPLESPAKEFDKKYGADIVKFVSDVRNGKLEGSDTIALATLDLLEKIISDSQNADAFELCGAVREAGARLSRALPQAPAAANTVRRVLRAIRDEQRASRTQDGTSGGGTESLQRLVRATPAGGAAATAPPIADLREPLRHHLEELRAETEGAGAAVCAAAREQLHAAELVLAYGGGRLLERFLRGCLARRARPILAEGPRPAQSHAMAARLSAAGVPVTLISNAAVCAVMSRVNKVVVGVHSVLAGGAVLGAAGLHGLTTAAHHYAVPVVALAPLHKLCPVHHVAQPAPAPPQAALRYGSSAQGSVHVFSPLHDSVPAHHITLFITNLGGSSPSYIYRLMSELYDPQDYQL